VREGYFTDFALISLCLNDPLPVKYIIRKEPVI